MKYKECERCEGKGHTQLQSCYDEIHSREECDVCIGTGYIINEDDEESEEQ